jgi:DNA-binding Xre family transcriptional regulator
MKWNLRLAAANRGIWKASEFQRLLGERGLVISAGKMSGLWSGEPHSIKLDELEVICSVLDCGPEELLLREPGTVAPTATAPATDASAVGDEAKQPPAVRPRAPRGRSLPPA